MRTKAARHPQGGLVRTSRPVLRQNPNRAHHGARPGHARSAVAPSVTLYGAESSSTQLGTAHLDVANGRFPHGLANPGDRQGSGARGSRWSIAKRDQAARFQPYR